MCRDISCALGKWSLHARWKFFLDIHWVTRPWRRRLTNGSDVKYVFPRCRSVKLVSTLAASRSQTLYPRRFLRAGVSWGEVVIPGPVHARAHCPPCFPYSLFLSPPVAVSGNLPAAFRASAILWCTRWSFFWITRYEAKEQNAESQWKEADLFWGGNIVAWPTFLGGSNWESRARLMENGKTRWAEYNLSTRLTAYRWTDKKSLVCC